MSFIQNFFTSRDNNANGATYVGQVGRLWYNPNDNNIYVSDGSTPGGIRVGGPLNPFNQNLNTSDSPTFANLTITNNVSTSNLLANAISTNSSIIVGNVIYTRQEGLEGQVLAIHANGYTYWIDNYGNVDVLSLLGNLGSNSISTSGNINVGNIDSTSIITGNLNSIGNVDSGNVNTGNLNASGILSVTGTQQSSIAGNLSMNNNIISNLATPINPFDAVTKQYADEIASNLHVHTSVIAATTTTLAATTSGLITYNNGANGVGATLSTTGIFDLIDTVNVQTLGSRILVKNEGNQVWNGVYTYSNPTTIIRATDFDSSANVAGGDFVFVTSGDVNINTGWIETTPNVIVGTSNIVFSQFVGPGTYTAGIGLTLTASQFSISNTGVTSGDYGSGDIVPTFVVNPQGQLTSASNITITANAANLTGDRLASNIINSNLSSVGILNNLSVTGNITGNYILGNGDYITNINANNIIGITSNANYSTYAGTAFNVSGSNVVGQVANANYATYTGTVTSSSQPNITSVGTLSNLSVNGNIISGNITTGTITTTGNITAPYFIGNFSGNITSPGSNTQVIFNDNGLLGASSAFTFNRLTNTVSMANSLSVTGNSNVGNIGGSTATFTNLTGNLTTAAQPNITSVGTLTSLTVNPGDITGTTGGGFTIGYLDIPQVTLASGATVTLGLTDRAKHYYFTGSGTATVTIPLNATVAFPIGTVITFVNNGSVIINIARTAGVALYLVGNSTNTNRSLSPYGMCTILKVATDTWYINGVGVV